MPVVDNAFEGYNGCILAYGQTGSGKTYTMMGQDDNVGLIPRLATDIFDRVEERKADFSYRVEASYFEIYNDKVTD